MWGWCIWFSLHKGAWGQREGASGSWNSAWYASWTTGPGVEWSGSDFSRCCFLICTKVLCQGSGHLPPGCRYSVTRGTDLCAMSDNRRTRQYKESQAVGLRSSCAREAAVRAVPGPCPALCPSGAVFPSYVCRHPQQLWLSFQAMPKFCSKEKVSIPHGILKVELKHGWGTG